MTARPVAALALLLAVSAPPAWSQVHRWVDDRGVVQYGDRPPASNAVSTLRVPVAPPPLPAAAAAPAPASARPASPAQPSVRTVKPASPPQASTIERKLAQQHAATAAASPSADSPGMRQLIEQCKANRGVDCDTPQGMRTLQRENTPITREEQARIAGIRARRAACARVRGSLGC